jgi:hypothetical protein
MRNLPVGVPSHLLSCLLLAASPLLADPPGQGWELVFHDEFHGDQLNWDVWTCEQGDRRSAYNDPADSYLDGQGHLILRIRKAEDGKYHLGFIRTKQSFQWGYYEARTDLNTVPGYWSAFWLWGPESYNPNYDGAEVDFMEDPYRDQIIEHNLHQGGGAGHQWEGARVSVKGSRQDWHLFGGDWREEGFDFYVDDQRTWVTRTMKAGKPNWIYLTLEAQFAGWAGDIRQSDSRLPAYWKVDYVRYYRRNPNAPAITLSQPEPIRLGKEDGKVVQVNLLRGRFGPVNPQRWSMENLPAGVTLGSVERVDDGTVRLRLKGNSGPPVSRAEIVDLTVIAEGGEVVDSQSLLIASRGVVLSVER